MHDKKVSLGGDVIKKNENIVGKRVSRKLNVILNKCSV